MRLKIGFIKQQLLLFEEIRNTYYGNKFIKGGYRMLE